METKYPLEVVTPRIDGFLKSVIKNGGFKLTYDIGGPDEAHSDFETPEIVVKFHGPDVELLLENRGELLLAIEQLTMEVLRMPTDEHSLLCFDANDYRVLRIQELRLSAGAAADRVRRTGVPFRFNPMNSRERRIIHLAMRDEAAVRSESSGVGPHRQVVIYPEGMPSSASAGEAPRAPFPNRTSRRRR